MKKIIITPETTETEKKEIFSNKNNFNNIYINYYDAFENNKLFFKYYQKPKKMDIDDVLIKSFNYRKDVLNSHICQGLTHLKILTNKKIIDKIKDVYSKELRDIDILHDNNKRIKRDIEKTLKNINDNWFFISYIREKTKKLKKNYS